MDRLSEAQRRSLSRRVDNDLLDEVVRFAFLSAQYYEDAISRGLARRSQYEAIEDTKQAVKLIFSY